jgi:DNA-binding transcriptional ArsR family regulator
VSRAAASASRELQTARALAHPLRLLLATEYALAVTSPSKIARTLEMPLNLVSYHTRVLADAGLLELVRVQPRRGAQEHYYRTHRDPGRRLGPASAAGAAQHHAPDARDDLGGGD